MAAALPEGVETRKYARGTSASRDGKGFTMSVTFRPTGAMIAKDLGPRTELRLGDCQVRVEVNMYGDNTLTAAQLAAISEIIPDMFAQAQEDLGVPVQAEPPAMPAPVTQPTQQRSTRTIFGKPIQMPVPVTQPEQQRQRPGDDVLHVPYAELKGFVGLFKDRDALTHLIACARPFRSLSSLYDLAYRKIEILRSRAGEEHKPDECVAVEEHKPDECVAVEVTDEETLVSQFERRCARDETILSHEVQTLLDVLTSERYVDRVWRATMMLRGERQDLDVLCLQRFSEICSRQGGELSDTRTLSFIIQSLADAWDDDAYLAMLTEACNEDLRWNILYCCGSENDDVAIALLQQCTDQDSLHTFVTGDHNWCNEVREAAIERINDVPDLELLVEDLDVADGVFEAARARLLLLRDGGVAPV